MMGYPIKRYLPLLSLLGIIVALLFLPIRVPFGFRTMGFIRPERQWSLKTDFDGNYVGETRNFRLGGVESVVSYRFERGDIATLLLGGLDGENSVIQSGETLGSIRSVRSKELLQQKENMLSVAMKELQAGISPEKTEVLEQLQQQIKSTEVQLEFTKAQFDRINQLFLDSLVPATTFETEKTNYLRAFAENEIAKSNYQSALSGVKPDEARLLEEKMNNLIKELEFVEQTNEAYTLTAPFGGKLQMFAITGEGGEYLSITDTATFILYAPVKLQFLPYISKETHLEFLIQGTDIACKARIFSIGDNTETFNGQQLVFVKALVEDPDRIALNGLSVQCQFSGENICIREYITRTLKLYLQ